MPGFIAGSIFNGTKTALLLHPVNVFQNPRFLVLSPLFGVLGIILAIIFGCSRHWDYRLNLFAASAIKASGVLQKARRRAAFF